MICLMLFYHLYILYCIVYSVFYTVNKSGIDLNKDDIYCNFKIIHFWALTKLVNPFVMDCSQNTHKTCLKIMIIIKKNK